TRRNACRYFLLLLTVLSCTLLLRLASLSCPARLNYLSARFVCYGTHSDFSIPFVSEVDLNSAVLFGRGLWGSCSQIAVHQDREVARTGNKQQAQARLSTSHKHPTDQGTVRAATT